MPRAIYKPIPDSVPVPGQAMQFDIYCPNRDCGVKLWQTDWDIGRPERCPECDTKIIYGMVGDQLLEATGRKP